MNLLKMEEVNSNKYWQSFWWRLTAKVIIASFIWTVMVLAYVSFQGPVDLVLLICGIIYVGYYSHFIRS